MTRSQPGKSIPNSLSVNILRFQVALRPSQRPAMAQQAIIASQRVSAVVIISRRRWPRSSRHGSTFSKLFFLAGSQTHCLDRLGAHCMAASTLGSTRFNMGNARGTFGSCQRAPPRIDLHYVNENGQTIWTFSTRWPATAKRQAGRRMDKQTSGNHTSKTSQGCDKTVQRPNRLRADRTCEGWRAIN